MEPLAYISLTRQYSVSCYEAKFILKTGASLWESYAQFLLLGHQGLMQHRLISICLKHKPVTSYNYKNLSRRCQYFKVKQENAAHNEKLHMSKN